ncbi:A disintegrin and metalloproteinase with thrombospondin motifs 18 [Bulinus truncatus]|nr:A disintegrin and metalloproteinase with thrombospondin motifs 18 [Bulinus truncatus]
MAIATDASWPSQLWLHGHRICGSMAIIVVAPWSSHLWLHGYFSYMVIATVASLPFQLWLHGHRNGGFMAITVVAPWSSHLWLHGHFSYGSMAIATVASWPSQLWLHGHRICGSMAILAMAPLPSPWPFQRWLHCYFIGGFIVIFSAYQPFIENNRVESGSELVDVSGVLEDFKNYVGQHYETNPSLPDHDIALLLTGEDLCKKKQDGTWSQKSKGIAYVRGGCISSRRFVNQSFDVGVAEVGRSFRGVLTAAHEVAHLLGAFHDGESNSTSCPAASGYIMSNTWTDPYIYNRFSNCSKQNLKHFLERTWYSECLLSSDSNYTTGYNTPTQLPGQVYTLAEQCQHYIEGTPCVNYPLESQCGQLCCEKWSQPFPSKEPAADGTVCGDRKMCYNGECLHQALIPY